MKAAPVPVESLLPECSTMWWTGRAAPGSWNTVTGCSQQFKPALLGLLLDEAASLCGNLRASCIPSCGFSSNMSRRCLNLTQFQKHRYMQRFGGEQLLTAEEDVRIDCSASSRATPPSMGTMSAAGIWNTNTERFNRDLAMMTWQQSIC